MDTEINLANIAFSDHSLLRFAKYYCKLFSDELQEERRMPLARETLLRSRRMSVEELRNWREKMRRYPGMAYYRYENFIFAISEGNGVVVTCMLFRGRRATRTKPKTRHDRPRAKQTLRQLLRHPAGLDWFEK